MTVNEFPKQAIRTFNKLAFQRLNEWDEAFACGIDCFNANEELDYVSEVVADAYGLDAWELRFRVEVWNQNQVHREICALGRIFN